MGKHAKHGSLVKSGLLTSLCLLATPVEACRHALSLGLDVSSSVDDVEYRLQLDGVIAAITAPAVQDILFAQPEAPIRIHVFEWSGPVNHTILVPWTSIENPAALAQIATTLRAHQRGVAAPTTSLGAAILAGFSYLDQHLECGRRTLDLSGDGETNSGTLPEDIGDEQRPDGVVVNGLVIKSGTIAGDDLDVQKLADYYATKVIRGPGAFVEIALGYTDYAAAMERKLIRELSAQVMGQSLPTRGDNG
jgi:hypothetical protein